MYAIEFQARIKNGVIEIPEEYRQQLRDQSKDNAVRVIILTSGRDTRTNLIDQLLEKSLKIPGFAPMKRDELYERE
jgi:hypothetical protein